jgi:hypothetical protein
MATWQLFANRPPPAIGTDEPGVVVVSGGVLYYLHEEVRNPAVSTSDTFAFYKLDAGVWTALTGPSMPDAEAFAPVADGDDFTAEYWRRVQAFDLGDGRLAFAGWLFHTYALYTLEQPDPYQPQCLIPTTTTHWVKRYVRVYTIATDTWTDYLDTVADVPVGSPVYDHQYYNATTLYPMVTIPKAKFTTFTAASQRASDGLVWMVDDGPGLPARTWDPATNLFAATHANCYLPFYVSRYVVELGPTFQDWGWFGWRDGNLEASRGNTTISGAESFVVRWNESTHVWEATTVDPHTAGPNFAEAAGGFEWCSYQPVKNELAWTFFHPGDGADPIGVRGVVLSAGAAFEAFSYPSEVLQDLGQSDVLTDLQAANLYRYSGGSYLVCKAGIYTMAVSGDVTPPTIHFHSPGAGATVGGAAEIVVHAEDEAGLAEIRLYATAAGGSAVLVAVYPVTGEDDLDEVATIVWNTTLFADGSYTLTAYAFDHGGNVSTAATLAVTVNNTTAIDVTPPVVVIQAPADGSTLSGLVTVTAHVTDDLLLAGARLLVRGTQVGSDVVLTGTLASQSWEVDLGEWSNGSATIQVFAWDAAGNQGSDTITVTIDNLVADQDAVLYTVELPVDDPVWRLDAGARLASCKLDVVTGEVPTDVRQVYNVYPYWSAGASPIAADYTTMTPFASRELLDVPSGAAALRFALVARPAQRESRWTVTDANEFFRLLLHGTRLIAVTREPVRVYEIAGANLILLVDVTSTPFSAAVLREVVSTGDKLLLGTDLGLLALDLDTGDQPALLRLDATTFDTAALAARGEVAFLRQNSKLWSYTWPSATILADTMPDGLLWADDQFIMAASTGASAALYTYMPTAGTGDSYGDRWLKTYQTSDAIARVYRDLDSGTGVLDLWLGCAAGIYRALPSWGKDATMAAEVRAFAKWRGWLWSAGDAAGIWRRGSSGWVEQLTLDDVLEVNDLTVVDDRLYAAVRTDAGGGLYKAEVVRLQVDLSGDFQCGPQPPDVLPRAVDYIDVEVQ